MATAGRRRRENAQAVASGTLRTRPRPSIVQPNDMAGLRGGRMASGRGADGGAAAMSPLEFFCVGERLEALPSGALHWPARRLMAVADLHLEKGSSYAVNALKLLPRHDTRQTLTALATLIEALKPDTVVCLGDSFHDRDAVGRLPTQESDAI